MTWGTDVHVCDTLHLAPGDAEYSHVQTNHEQRHDGEGRHDNISEEVPLKYIRSAAGTAAEGSMPDARNDKTDNNGRDPYTRQGDDVAFRVHDVMVPQRVGNCYVSVVRQSHQGEYGRRAKHEESGKPQRTDIAIHQHQLGLERHRYVKRQRQPQSEISHCELNYVEVGYRSQMRRPKKHEYHKSVSAANDNKEYHHHNGFNPHQPQ